MLATPRGGLPDLGTPCDGAYQGTVRRGYDPALAPALAPAPCPARPSGPAPQRRRPLRGPRGGRGRAGAARPRRGGGRGAVPGEVLPRPVRGARRPARRGPLGLRGPA